MRPLVRFLLLLIFVVPIGAPAGLSGVAWAGPPDAARLKPRKVVPAADPALLCE